MAGISVIVVVVVAFLHILAFVLAIGAEMRRSTGKVVPDEYDERTFCAYDSDASTAYGLSAFGLLLLSQAVVSAATRCLCFGRGLSAGGPRTCAIASFVVSWMVTDDGVAGVGGGGPLPLHPPLVPDVEQSSNRHPLPPRPLPRCYPSASPLVLPFFSTLALGVVHVRHLSCYHPVHSFGLRR
ncbi:uncharacterized protein LOC103991878 isoform X2 [Musa acuminata AAA Group]|uniref:uncharacterized protein LOC103991878 isoform X2 n=1 Tax=Musa acuminata AAA Group TaxID=214697 RepID=UPI0031D30E1A